MQRFSRGEFTEALTDPFAAESLPPMLYPNDSTVRGQDLRWMQEYAGRIEQPARTFQLAAQATQLDEDERQEERLSAHEQQRLALA